MLLRVGVQLNGLAPGDVKLECLLGRETTAGELDVQQTEELSYVGDEDGQAVFGIELDTQLAGLQYYKLRMYPFNAAQSHPFELGAMLWI